MTTNNQLTKFPDYYTNFVNLKSGKIDDAWYRALTSFRRQLDQKITINSSDGIEIVGSPAGPGDTVEINVSNDLKAVEDLNSTGFAVRTANETWSTRQILGTADKIDVTNPAGILDNPILTISPTYAGQTSITTLGTITTVASISSPAFISFDTTTNLNTLPGRLTWSDFEGTLSLGLKGGNVSLQLGQEMVMRGYNRTGSTISNGEVVYVLGAHAQELEVGVADNSSYSTSQATIGVATEDILNNADGFFTTHGQVHDLNTSSFSEGDELWLGTSGAFTNVRPTAPTQKVNIGYVVRSHPTQGIIFVKPSPADDLSDLSNVNIATTPTNGQVLTYVSANSRWEPSTVVGGGIDHILNEDFTTTYWYSLYSTYIRRINVSVTPFLVQTAASTDWANRYTLTYV